LYPFHYVTKYLCNNIWLHVDNTVKCAKLIIYNHVQSAVQFIITINNWLQFQSLILHELWDRFYIL